MNKQDEILKKLLVTFTDEANEHIQSISSGLVILEKGQEENEREETIETIFRDAHSLKGAARAVNLKGIETICQSLENVFAGFKSGDKSTSPGKFDSLHKAVDAISELVEQPEKKMNEIIVKLAMELDGVSTQVEKAPETSDPVPSGRSSDSARGGSGQKSISKRLSAATVRIPAQRLDALLLQVEELLGAKLAAKRCAGDLFEITAGLETWTKRWAKAQPEALIAGRILDKENEFREKRKTGLGAPVGKILDFLNWNHSYIESLKSGLAVLSQSADADARFLERMVEDLLRDMKRVLMLPFSSILDVFPKMMRDLSRESGKEVELVIEGSEVEIDKRILDSLRDPLIHLLRNSLDHGIEDPIKREQAGKQRCARISVAIKQVDGSKVEIIVSDDGSGIDPARVKTAAVKTGVRFDETGEQGELDLLRLLCLSGISTSPIITDISGRGLGLAIVREKVEELGGALSMKTLPGTMTAFRILLPLTLSAFRGVLIKAAGQEFIVPSINVERVLRLKREDISTIENREAVQINGEAISFVSFADALGLPEEGRNNRPLLLIVILHAAGRHIAFGVDEILGEMEVLVKKLGPQLLRVRNIAGAMIQSSGGAVPIINIPDLFKAAVTVSIPSSGETVKTKTRTEGSILIAEDSITSRMLLKNILESAGYVVTTAVDGIDAITVLKTQDVDLVVSDINMPRMDGFELTAKIRGDEKLSDLPIVLVSSLSSREDQERGVDAGADAYILKGSFDQNVLLETIERLI
ncbi:MAG: response regulator [Spirochaetales bacterium]|nr:response regulator [Spirochaetales bacterium]